MAKGKARFDGVGAAVWGKRLAADRDAVGAQLAQAGAACLPVLRELLVHAEVDEVAQAAARLCEQLGEGAATAVPELLHSLEMASSWWTQVYCGRALAAIGAARLGEHLERVRASLLAHVTRAEVPALRGHSLDSLARLDEHVAERLLAALRAGGFADPQFAVDALRGLGVERADAMIDELGAGAGSASHAVVSEALAGMGWRVFDRLQRAGHDALARQALLRGPLELVPFGKEHRLAYEGALPNFDRLPAVEWEFGWKHGQGFRLGRGQEVPAGYRIDVLVLGCKDASGPREYVAEVRTATIARRRAAALVSQLFVLAEGSLVAKDPARLSAGTVMTHFHAAARVLQDGKVTFDEAFVGYPSGGNMEVRFRPQAAKTVLEQAVEDGQWEMRPPTEADVQFVRAKAQAVSVGRPEWVTKALTTLAELLER